MKKANLFVFLILFLFISAKEYKGNEDRSYLSLYLGHHGEEELVKTVIRSANKFLYNLVKNREDLSSVMRFGATDKDTCKQTIEKFNRGEIKQPLTVWTTCPGLPSGFFVENIYDKKATSYFSFWDLATTVGQALYGLDNEWIYPRPMIFELNHTTLETFKIGDPITKCDRDTCTLKFFIESLDLSTNVKIYDTLNESLLFQFSNFKLQIKKSNTNEYPYFSLVVKINGKGNKQLLEIDKKKGELYIPEGSISVSFKNGNERFIDILTSCSGISKSKEEEIRTMLKRVQAATKRFIGNWTNILNLDVSLETFFDNPENLKEISELVNNKIFPLLIEKLHKYLDQYPLFKGDERKIEVMPLEHIVSGLLFEKFYSSYYNQITETKDKLKKEVAKTKRSEMNFTDSLGLKTHKGHLVKGILKTYESSSYGLGKYRMELLLAHLSSLIPFFEEFENVIGSSLVENYKEEIDLISKGIIKTGDLMEANKNNLVKGASKKNLFRRTASQRRLMHPLSMSLRTNLLKDENIHSLIVDDGTIKNNDLKKIFQQNHLTEESLLGIHLNINSLNSLLEELYNSHEDYFSFCYTKSKLHMCAKNDAEFAKSFINVKFIKPWQLFYDHEKNQIYLLFETKIIEQGKEEDYQSKIYLKLNEGDKFTFSLDYPTDNPILTDTAEFIDAFLTQTITVFDQLKKAYDGMDQVNPYPIESMEVSPQEVFIYLKEIQK